MTGFDGSPTAPNLLVEAVIALVVAGAFAIASMIKLRRRHFDTPAWHVHLGAGIYGLVFGAVIGFVLVPLRLLVMSDGHVPAEVSAWSGLGFVLVMIALRRGLLGRLPYLGPQVRAYRRASLRRVIEASQKELDKLEAHPDPAVKEVRAQ